MNTIPEKREISIVGTGHALPSGAVSSEMLDLKLGLPKGSVERRTGVAVRYFSGGGEYAAEFAARACRAALDDAGLTLADIDVLVAASGTMDQALPCNASLILRELGEGTHIPAFDINASCMSFLAALDQISWPLAAGRYRNALVVSSDIASCGLDWSRLEASGIFGDGAAAAVVSRGSGSSGIWASRFETYAEGVEFCRIRGGGTRFHPTRLAEGESLDGYAYFQMDGKKVFRLVSETLPAFLEELLQAAGLRLNDIDCIIPHQASLLALQHMDRRLGWDPAKVVNIFRDHGNQIAASLPTALHLACSTGRLRRGMKALLLGTGAGVTLGGIVLEF